LRKGDPWGEEMNATSNSFGNAEGHGKGICCAEGVPEEAKLIDCEGLAYFQDIICG
jgi:hypothetical protein